MELSKNLKKIIIAGASVLMTVSVASTGNVANARHRRYHYRYTRRAWRNIYKYGYYKHGRYHYYRTGYFRNGKWIKRHKPTHNKHTRYMWMAYADENSEGYAPVRVIGGRIKSSIKGVYNYHFQPINKHWAKVFKECGYGNTMVSGNFTTHKPSTASNNHSKINFHHNKKATNNTITNNIDEMKSQTLTDINKDRESNGLQPVQQSSQMDQIANMRAQQASRNFTHYDANNNNQPYELEDAQQLGIQFGKGNYLFTENLANSYLKEEIEASPSGMPAVYNNNGNDMANNINKGLMNYDTSSNPSTNWGHRNNILYAPWRYVGVGVAKNNGNHYTLAEDFASWVR